jgi:hypothetical protein
MLHQVGLVHGKMQKVCPHFSTGRADYFGSTVNRGKQSVLTLTSSFAS